MKIRRGHISNSSSSSFIIGVDKPLDTIESVKEQIFNNAGAFTNGWVSDAWGRSLIQISDLCNYFIQGTSQTYSTEHWNGTEWVEDEIEIHTLEDVLKIKELVEQIGANCRHYTHKLNKEWYEDLRACNTNEDYSKHSEKWDKIDYDLGRKFVEEHKSEFEGKILYFGTYADEDGHIGSNVEHGHHWRKVTHIRISNH